MRSRAIILLSICATFVGIELVGLMSGLTFMSSIQQLASTGFFSFFVNFTLNGPLIYRRNIYRNIFP